MSKYKRPEVRYDYRGPVERGFGGSYEWRDGFSATSPEGNPYYPWNTVREIRSAENSAGNMAVFYRDGKRILP
jgi:hypothetical protein